MSKAAAKKLLAGATKLLADLQATLPKDPPFGSVDWKMLDNACGVVARLRNLVHDLDAQPSVAITIHYEGVDRFRKTRTFKTLDGAQKFAQKYVGATPEISSAFQYAVSGDGVGKVTCHGASIYDLFPKCTRPEDEPQ